MGAFQDSERILRQAHRSRASLSSHQGVKETVPSGEDFRGWGGASSRGRPVPSERQHTVER